VTETAESVHTVLQTGVHLDIGTKHRLITGVRIVARGTGTVNTSLLP
jgi:hypothetical protein